MGAVQDPSKSYKEPAGVEHIGSLVLDSSFTPSTFGDRQLFFRHTFFRNELEGLFKTDPYRAAAWSTYANNQDNYKHEGANIYWPLLPGGREQLLQIANRTQKGAPEKMLQGDLAI